MPIKPPTAVDLALAAKREAFMKRHGLRDFKLSGRSLMRMVRRVCPDAALVDLIRKRFTCHYATDLKMEHRTWDHLEMFGRSGHFVALVAHPYSISAAGREDMAIFRRAGLVVVEGGEDASWYGYGTTQILVAHPAFSGQVVRPAPSPIPPPVESAYEARLRRAAPALLSLARGRAVDLSASIALIPCAGPRAVTSCVSCEMRVDLDRINALIAEIEGPR